jgi:integrase
MEPTAANRGQKRVNLPSKAEQEVVELTVQLLIAKSGTVFGRGFRLRAIGQRLYVQLSGLKVPLYLDFDAPPMDVQNRGLELRSFLLERDWVFNSEAWRDACAVSRVRKGKPPERRLRLENVIDDWHRLKRAEGLSDVTLSSGHLSFLRRLNPDDPLSQDSLLRAIEQTDPRSSARRRCVPLLRRLCAMYGAPWNAALLDPLQNSGKSLFHRAQPFFTDEEIEGILRPGTSLPLPYRRVVTLLAIYGLRPWEGWIAEPCTKRPGCVWIGKGKTNSRGTNSARRVPPFHAEWIKLFGMDKLWDAPLPALAKPSYAGRYLNQALRRAGLFAPDGATSYGFRHAYARRLHSPRYRVVDTHAALFLGHTVGVHYQTYRNWLGGEDPIGLYLDCPS